MIEKNEIFTKSVDVNKLTDYLTERQYQLEYSGVDIRVDGVILNPEAAALVIRDTSVRSRGIDNHILNSTFRVLSDASLEFDQMRLIIFWVSGSNNTVS